MGPHWRGGVAGAQGMVEPAPSVCCPKPGKGAGLQPKATVTALVVLHRNMHGNTTTTIIFLLFQTGPNSLHKVGSNLLFADGRCQ